MSLKAFHIFFVAISTLLALGFAVWCLTQYQTDRNPAHLIAAVASLLSAVGLVVYGARFLKKLKGISYL